MANYVQVTIAGAAGEKAEILLALLSEMQYEGFEETAEGLKAFISQAAFDAQALQELMGTQQCTYTLLPIAAQNWNEQWESSFEPVRINDFAAIRAGFHQPLTNVQYDIVITPKMSFGTGHHATTSMMVEQMATINFTGKSVLDFGTGTGVLAILAAKMGAAHILAIDNDDWSISNSVENIAANGCGHIQIEKAETIPGNIQFDVILANINLNVITASLPLLASACKPGANVLLSGFLQGDEAVLIPMLEQKKFQKIKVFEQNNWRCITAMLS
jgi:ribosomal protein L11 methyltransferase